MEDRPIVIERKEYIKEHHPIEKEYRVETKCAPRSILHNGADLDPQAGSDPDPQLGADPTSEPLCGVLRALALTVFEQAYLCLVTSSFDFMG